MNSAADFTRVNRGVLLSALPAVPALGSAASVQRAVAQAQQAAPLGKPNTLVIMGDDVGWFNVGAYHQGHRVRLFRLPAPLRRDVPAKAIPTN
jgi:arylsulfatase